VKTTPAGEQPPAPPPAHGPYRPIARGPAGGLTPAQRKQLDAFIARYVKRTAESKRMTEANRSYLADPRTVAGFRQIWKEMVYPIVVDRSAGSKLWDVDGNEYVDLVCGFGPILLGHNPAIVRDAIKAQLEHGIETGPQTPLAGKVARLFCEMTGMERVAYCNTGSEAVMAAIRVARTVSGRDLIVMFSGAYHGIFDEVLVRSATMDGQPRAMPLAPGIPSNMAQNILVLEYGSPAALDVIEKRGSEIAAVLVEPVQSRRPELQPREFVKKLRALTEASGTALVLDEVVSGFRSHAGGIQALWDVRADLATYGKVVGGGLPIGLVAGCAKYMDALDGGSWRYGDESFPEVGVTFFAGTFVRHPLVLAAAHAVLTHLKSQGEELQRRLNLRTTQLVERLTREAAQLGAPVRITHFSSWFCFHFPAELPYASLFYAYMRDRGVHLWEGRAGFITTAHSEQDLDMVVRAFRESVAEMQAANFLPGGEEQPPVSGARRGRTPSGNSAWFVPDPERPGKYLQLAEEKQARG
jgi:glutamate-1-semialdehyde aminotransferase